MVFTPHPARRILAGVVLAGIVFGGGACAAGSQDDDHDGGIVDNISDFIGGEDELDHADHVDDGADHLPTPDFTLPNTTEIGN